MRRIVSNTSPALIGVSALLAATFTMVGPGSAEAAPSSVGHSSVAARAHHGKHVSHLSRAAKARRAAHARRVARAKQAAQARKLAQGKKRPPVVTLPVPPVAGVPLPVLSDPVMPVTNGPRFRVSPAGNDSADGSVDRPWRTLARASRTRMVPGSVLLLDRGATYTGSLVVSSSGTAAEPITVAPTGEGALPVISSGDCVRLTGSYVTVTGVLSANCTWTGFSVEGAHDTITQAAATGNVVGVHVTPSATDTVVAGSHLYDNKRLSPGKNGSNDDSGVNGVIVQGQRTTILRNLITGHAAPSPDYGIEGSAVEVYGAKGTTIAGNSSIDNATFVELGDRSTSATRIVRNSVLSKVANSYFVVTRGAADTFGPVLGTVVDHNSVAMNGSGGGGLICYGGCSPAIMSASGNVIVATQKPTWSDGSGMGGGNNLLVNDSTMRAARPVFVDRLRDLTLAVGSPALDGGEACATPTRIDTPHPALGTSSDWCDDGDADGRMAMDLGAIER